MSKTLHLLLSALRKVKRIGCAPEDPAPDLHWRYENRGRLIRALEGGIAVIKKERAAAALFERCRAFLASGRPVTPRDLAAFFLPAGLSLSEYEMLFPLLKAAAAAAATEEGEGERQIRNLYAVGRLDADALRVQLCEAEGLLRLDPAGAYAHMDPAACAVYRRAVIRESKKRGTADTAVVRRALAAAEKGKTPAKRHVGAYLALPRPRRLTGGALVIAEGALCAALAAAAAGSVFPDADSPAPRLLWQILLFFPLFGAGIGIVRPLREALRRQLVPPFFLPRLDADDLTLPLPKAVCVLSGLVPAAGDCGALERRLETLYAADPLPGGGVILLLDPPTADEAESPGDRADLQAVKTAVDRLNARTGGGFLLAARRRTYAPTEDAYTGHERKRGAIEALVQLIADGACKDDAGEDAFSALYGDRSLIEGTEYLFLLDWDTEPAFGALRTLLCTAAHPLNRAYASPDGTLQSGFGCFTPRTEPRRPARDANVFRRVFAGGGIRLYAPGTGETMMDLFGSASFCGKGLVDVGVYRRRCCGAFPPGRVLSHDVLEGGLLRTAFVGGAVVSESFPSSPGAFFRRQDRWIRGDVQNARFLFGRLKNGARLPFATRLRAADNLLRALLPVWQAACLAAALRFPFPGAVLLTAAGILGRSFDSLLQAGRIFLRRGADGFRRAPGLSAFPEGTRALLQAVCAAALTFPEAVCSLRALCVGAFRGFISHKKTLQWTTAAESESGKALLPVLPALLWCLAAFVFPSAPLCRIAAAIFTAALPLMYLHGDTAGTDNGPSTDARRQLRSFAAAHWRFFETFVGEEDHFLPPDNVQEQPVFRIAHRTSPTDIGMYLTGLLAAADLSLITPGTLAGRLKKTLETLCVLPKWKGLLYNWYDTKTLAPLPPFFVSSVDCGNYLVCLETLRSGLRDYLPAAPELKACMETVAALLKEGDLGALYDRRRGCFSVGCTAPAGAADGACYDHYMSEARLLSYYAAAKRLVPASHWPRLSRPLFAGGFGRAASWSGTVFEYFMPALFLPVYENTYQHAGLMHCLRIQRRNVRFSRLPGGVSESGYYAFDPAMNYRYRANGLPALAIRDDVCGDRVFAPYAAFLMLPFDVRTGIRRLHRFFSYGAYGAYGFYEALDCTGGKPRTVTSYMAHHVGMSMVAVVNTLSRFRFVERFCAAPELHAALSLLEESVPLSSPVRPPRRTPREMPRRAPAAGAPTDPAGLYTDGGITLAVSREGGNRLLWGGLSLLNASARATGAAAALKTEEGTFRLTDGPFSLLPGGAYCRKQAGGAETETLLTLPDPDAFALAVKVRNTGGSRVMSLLFYLEPSFQSLADPGAHPAFSDLRLRTAWDPEARALVFSRVRGGRASVFFALGLRCTEGVSFLCDRESFPGYAPLGNDLFSAPLPPFTNTVGGVSPAAAIRCVFSLGPGEKKETVLMLVPGMSRTQALGRLQRLRRRHLPAFPDRQIRLGFPSQVSDLFARFLSGPLFGADDPERKAAAQNNRSPLSVLWQEGISGEMPVMRVKTDGLPREYTAALTEGWRKLREAGVATELVLLTEGIAYGDPRPAQLKKLLAEKGLSDAVGAPGGVFLTDPMQAGPAFMLLLAACPGITCPAGDDPLIPQKKPARLLPAKPLFSGENAFVPGGYFIGRIPPRPWCHTLSNRSFGTLVSSCSLGFTWALNARLNQLTPWESDRIRDQHGEQLLLHTPEGTFNCICGSAVYFYDTRALYGADCAGRQLRITVETDAAAMKKRVSVQRVDRRADDVWLTYRIAFLLGEDRRALPYVRVRATKNALVADNPANTLYPGTAGLFCYRQPTAKELQADILWPDGAPKRVFCDAKKGEVRVLLCAGQTCTFIFGFAHTEKALRRLAALPFKTEKRQPLTVRTGIPDLDRFAGALLLHQVIDTRLFARCGFYQCSGAYGFRDQLQDVLPLCVLRPALARRQLLLAGAAQFPEGDVLHWFHLLPAAHGRHLGVRTRCSDDMLFLPYVLSVYVTMTHDRAILDVRLPFLTGDPLGDREESRYRRWQASDTAADLYTHAMLAVRRACRFGAHGLPLFGSGDWNDAFDAAGRRGRGESVWLAMFLRLVCLRFLPVAASRDAGDAAFLQETAARMQQNVLSAAWDGSRFLRGFYDDGSPLGGGGEGPCSIDLLPQAFAVFAGVGSPDMRKTALKTAFETLFDPDSRTLRLFTPPFSAQEPYAGYVNDYPPGVRENGGQYTHAAVWFALALKKEGLGAEYRRLVSALLPPEEPSGPSRPVYRNEPYALSGDVAASPGPVGLGGWSLYTGAAGWMLTLVLQEAGLWAPGTENDILHAPGPADAEKTAGSLSETAEKI